MTEDTRKLQIYSERCKGCTLCVDVCPVNVLEMGKKVNKRGCQYVVLKDPEKCTRCGMCFVMCPDSALEIVETGKEK